MSAVLLDGEAVAKKIKDGLRKEIEGFKASGKELKLVAVQVGENAASRVYVNQQKKACEEIGVKYELKELPAVTTEKGLLDFIEGLNNDAAVTGIILQMPLPKEINPRNIQVKISPKKDVEGLNPYNMGLLVYGKQVVAPCTAMGAVELLKSSGVELKGKEVVIIGHSEIVGKPILLLMLQSLTESPTPTVCHIATKDTPSHTKKADIVFVAVGRPGLVRAEMLKPGAIVIDIGINRVPVLDANGAQVMDEKTGRPKMKTVGDVDFEKAKKVCGMISPVPGGVGPLTVTMLIKNTIECSKWQNI
ncbi:MAG: bifunctional 5,10-methylenetetrahydrofolate dehydrogenase/5,10-methenyltetrahydrofolate cyclohydrolase [Candidatus Firestonebacteria bacterium]|nr:bifunctional 5,10-methylenetetrahydrofolate dehydrogenase/5,10-methenyltetrahydrofolate cyclohydrolase [Candidatus Firestonebacteria bacterium]